MQRGVSLREHIEGFMPRRGRNDRGLIGVNVVELGLSSLFRLRTRTSLPRHQLRNFA